MENVSLKKGLFGYTQSSVQEYIEALNGELTARANKFVLENEELKKKCELYEDKINESNAKQDELLEKINVLSKEIETYLSDKSKLHCIPGRVTTASFGFSEIFVWMVQGTFRIRSTE